MKHTKARAKSSGKKPKASGKKPGAKKPGATGNRRMPSAKRTSAAGKRSATAPKRGASAPHRGIHPGPPVHQTHPIIRKSGMRVITAATGEPRPPRCLVLSGFGLNAELELSHAFSLAGADSKIVHFSDISSGAQKLEDFEIFAIPGGWSFADEISSGRVLANKLKSTFRSQFESFAASGKPVLGICNGFQVLVKLGALPNLSLSFSQEATLTHNASGKFEDRWVNLKPQKSVCKYFEGVEFINCPVRHGEGRLIFRDSSVLAQIEKKGLVALKYTNPKLEEDGYPWNPNGAVKNIAAISDTTGKILGMMPHPECSVYPTQFPLFRSGVSHEKNSRRFFENIVEEGKKYV